MGQAFKGNEVRLANLYLQQTGADFLDSPAGVSLVNGTVNPILTAIRTNVPSVTAPPNKTWGGVLEWTYAVTLTRWLTVQPDVQYVINPGGRSSVGNAVVIGAQLAAEF